MSASTRPTAAHTAWDSDTSTSYPYDDEYDYYWFQDYWYFDFTYLVFGGLAPFLMSLFGVVTNIINMIVFYRQGILSDNCTPILAGLAVSDFCCCTIVCVETCGNTIFEFSFVFFRTYTRAIMNFVDIGLIVTFPAPMFKMISSYITFYLALERMVSVTFPFRVKRIFQPKLSVAVIVCMFIVTFLLNVPSIFYDEMTIEYDAYGIDIDYDYSGMIDEDLKNDVKFLNDLILRPITMLSVVLFNVIIIIKVRISKRFKNSSGSESHEGNKTNEKKGSKEIKLIKMMIVLSFLFVVCYILRVTTSFGLYVVDIPSVAKNYIIPINTFIEVFNSCINFVVYYKMSTRYRQETQHLFSSCRVLK